MTRRITVLALLGLVGLAAGVLWFSPVFDVREVRIFGTHFTTVNQVLEAARIRIGQPIARVDARATELRVHALPEVASVEVRRGFPHSIVIEVHERVGIAAAQDEAGDWWLVDRTGAMFHSVQSRPADLLQVRGYTEQLRGIGARTAATFPRWLHLRVALVDVQAPEDIRLEMKNGKQVVWGGEDRPARKAEVLFALLQVHAGHYDVSAPDAPATRK